MSRIRVVMNSLSGVGLFLTDAIVSLIMTPIIVLSLGNRDYGLWELMLGIVGYLGILDIGMGPAVMRDVAHAEARSDTSQLNRVFNTGVAALGFAGLVGGLLVAALSVWGDRIVGVRSADVPYISLLFLLFALHLVVGFLMTAVTAFMMGLQQHRLINSVRIVMSILQALLVYKVLRSGVEPALIYMSMVVLGINSLQALGFAAWVLRRSPARLNSKDIRIDTARYLLTFGMKSTLLMASGALLKRAALFVIAHVVSVAAVVYFVIPNRLAEYAQSLGLAVGFPLTPYFAALDGQGGVDATREAWFPVTRALQLVTLGVPVGVAWMGEPFLNRWMGAEYAQNGHVVLYMLCGALLVQGAACNANRVLMSMGRHGRIALLSAILSPVAVGLSVVLGKQWGIIGVAAAIVIYGSLQACGELYFACKELRIAVSEHLRRTVATYIVPLLLCSGSFLALRHWSVPDTYDRILAHAAVGAATYLVSVFLFALHRRERQAMIAWLYTRFSAAEPKTP